MRSASAGGILRLGAWEDVRTVFQCIEHTRHTLMAASGAEVIIMGVGDSVMAAVEECAHWG